MPVRRNLYTNLDLTKVWIYKGKVYCTHRGLPGVFEVHISKISKV